MISFLVYQYPVKLDKNKRPVIFVIDSSIDSKYLKRPLPKINQNTSHGNIVISVLRKMTSTRIIPYSVEDISGKVDKEKYLSALQEINEFIRKNPEKRVLINISLGFQDEDFQKKIIEDITSSNAVIIAAAGNNNSKKKLYPAGFPSVVAVSAIENDKKMPGSNYGSYINISASGSIKISEYFSLPGYNFIRNKYITGTSFAAPRVTGLTAEILSYNDKLSTNESLELVYRTASPISDKLYSENKLGAGKIMPIAALNKASPIFRWSRMFIFVFLTVFSILIFILLWRSIGYASFLILIIFIFILPVIQIFPLYIINKLGLINVILIMMFFILLLWYSKTLIKNFIKYINSITILLFILNFLPQTLKKPVEKRVILLINHNNDNDSIFKIKNKLINSISMEKTKSYLRILSNIDRPPFLLMINKINNFNISPSLIGKELNCNDSNKKGIITGELINIILEGNYEKASTAADILKTYDNQFVLQPLKNIIKKRESKMIKSSGYTKPYWLYFILDVVGSFKEKASDFSFYLRSIIEDSEDEWLRYYAVKAYIAAGKLDPDYGNYLSFLIETEKEPVKLALREHDYA